MQKQIYVCEVKQLLIVSKYYSNNINLLTIKL